MSLSEDAQQAARVYSAHDRFSNILDRSFGTVAALVLGSLMALTFCDVVSRYFFNSPITGAFELVELLMGALIFTALPVVTARDLHVTIDLLDSFVPPRLARLRDALVDMISVAVLAAISWRLWGLGQSKLDYGDTTAFLNIPLYPVAFGMSVLTGFTALCAAVLFCLHLFQFSGSRPRREP